MATHPYDPTTRMTAQSVVDTLKRLAIEKDAQADRHLQFGSQRHNVVHGWSLRREAHAIRVALEALKVTA